MADEKRIATEEWLDGNLNEFKKRNSFSNKKMCNKRIPN